MSKEVAVSFRVSFDGEGVTANGLYKMEGVVTDWLRETVNKGDIKALGAKLEAAAGVPVPEFYLWVIADLSYAKEGAIMERVREGQPA